MNPGMGRAPQSLRSPDHVRLGGAAKCGHRHVATFSRDRFDRREIAIRRDRKARLDNIDAQALELSRQAKLFLEIHRAARRLLAIPQSRVEDFYAFLFHRRESPKGE